MSEKLNIIAFSGTVDKMMAVSTLSTGAAAMGMDVDIFITFWGLNAFRKENVYTNMRISADFAEFQEPMMQAMQAKGVPAWIDVLHQAAEIGNVHVKACSQTMEMFGWTMDDFDPIVEEVTGVASFMGQLNDGDTTLFI